MTSTMMETPTVVWADDAVLIRMGLVGLLRGAGVDVIGEAHDFDSTIRAVVELAPDVVILDVRMPPTCTDEGIRAAVELRRRGRVGGVLVVSQDVDAATAALLLSTYDGRGVGYLLKERLAAVSTFVESIHRVNRGETVLDPLVVERLMARPRHSDLLGRLTPTEKLVLAKVAEGFSNRGIAAALCIGERTVETHVSRIFDQLDLPRAPEVHRRVQAAIAFLRSLI